MRALPEVREFHECSTRRNRSSFLKIVSKDLQAFQEFLTGKLTPAPNVESVKNLADDPYRPSRSRASRFERGKAGR